jgi:hypothetical protein
VGFSWTPRKGQAGCQDAQTSTSLLPHRLVDFRGSEARCTKKCSCDIVAWPAIGVSCIVPWPTRLRLDLSQCLDEIGSSPATSVVEFDPTPPRFAPCKQEFYVPGRSRLASSGLPKSRPWLVWTACSENPRRSHVHRPPPETGPHTLEPKGKAASSRLQGNVDLLYILGRDENAAGHTAAETNMILLSSSCSPHGDLKKRSCGEQKDRGEDGSQICINPVTSSPC